MTRLALTASLFVSATSMGQDFLLVPDSASDTIQKFDPATGAPLGLFATMPITGPGATPKEALQVGFEVWVSDQLQDNIVRFDMFGAYLGEVLGPAQGLDNIRGFEVAGGKIWITCGAGMYAGQVAVFAQDSRQFLFAVNVGGNPFDAAVHGGAIYVTNSVSHDIDMVAFDGTIIGKFVDSAAPDEPLDFPQQIAFSATEAVVAEFSSFEQLFRFDLSGALLEEIATPPQGGVRGVYPLADGAFLFANMSGVHVYRPGDGVHTMQSGGSYHYINAFTYPSPCPADFNADRFLDFFDYLDFVACFEGSACPPNRTADFNGDGFVDSFDYQAFVQGFESGC